MNNIALIGGTGFIGTNLANYFSRLNYEVLVVGRIVDKNKYLDKNISFLETDINSSTILNPILCNYSNVVWLINNLIPGSDNISFQSDIDSNLFSTISMLNQLSSSPKKYKFFYFSSGGTVYGNPSILKPIKETQHKAPISQYGLSKAVAELYVEYITKKSNNIHSYILRPSNVYGKYQNIVKPQGFIGFAMLAAIKNSAIELYGNGAAVRDFIFVEDLCEAIFKCINADFELSNTDIFNIGSNHGISIKNTLELIEEVSGKKISIINKPERSLDCNYNTLNTAAIKNKLGWKPVYNLESGLKIVWDWFMLYYN